MKLQSVQIKDFRSILDSNKFEVGDITCLVGKNESGKTAILHALYKLNPLIDSEGKFDVTEEYPRYNVEDYRASLENGCGDSAIVTHLSFSLESSELESIQNEFGEAILKEPTLYLSKGYDNILDFHLELNE